MLPLTKVQLSAAVQVNTQLRICRRDIACESDATTIADHIHYRWHFIQTLLQGMEAEHGELEPFDSVDNRYRYLLGLLQPGMAMPPSHQLTELLDECMGYLHPYVDGK